jgi:hypothetical protein
MMSTSHNVGERRPAVWPWLLMPVVVLMVFFTLQRFRHLSETASAGPETRTSTSDMTRATE